MLKYTPFWCHEEHEQSLNFSSSAVIRQNVYLSNILILCLNSSKLNDIPGSLVILFQIKQMCECEGVRPKYVTRRSVLPWLLWLEMLNFL